jgi:hypothetical protein
VIENTIDTLKQKLRDLGPALLFRDQQEAEELLDGFLKWQGVHEHSFTVTLMYNGEADVDFFVKLTPEQKFPTKIEMRIRVQVEMT